MATSLDHIEANQGIGDGGSVFGYDLLRRNFISWAIECGKIVVANVEHDDQEQQHGSLDATMRDARRVAARENRLPASRLRMAIERAERAANDGHLWGMTVADAIAAVGNQEECE